MKVWKRKPEKFLTNLTERWKAQGWSEFRCRVEFSVNDRGIIIQTLTEEAENERNAVRKMSGSHQLPVLGFVCLYQGHFRRTHWRFFSFSFALLSPLSSSRFFQSQSHFRFLSFVSFSSIPQHCMSLYSTVHLYMFARMGWDTPPDAIGWAR